MFFSYIHTFLLALITDTQPLWLFCGSPFTAGIYAKRERERQAGGKKTT